MDDLRRQKPPHPPAGATELRRRLGLGYPCVTGSGKSELIVTSSSLRYLLRMMVITMREWMMERALGRLGQMRRSMKTGYEEGRRRTRLRRPDPLLLRLRPQAKSQLSCTKG